MRKLKQKLGIRDSKHKDSRASSADAQLSQAQHAQQPRTDVEAVRRQSSNGPDSTPSVEHSAPLHQPENSREIPPGVKHDQTSISKLWDIAYENLWKEDEDLATKYEANLRASLTVGLASSMGGTKLSKRELMRTVLERKMDEVNRDAWKLKFGSSEVQVKDLVEPVVSVIGWANAFVTSAVSANPDASMAWAGVSLLLPLLLNPTQQAASLAKGLEYISSLIVQSRMWEDLYIRQCDSGTADQESYASSHFAYKNALEMLYRQILKFQATAYCYYASRTISRFGRDVIKWDDWSALMDDIREQERVFSSVNQSWRDVKYDEERMAAEERHRKTLDRWDTIGMDVSGLRKAVEDAQAEKMRRKLLKWLCDIDPSEIYNIARGKHKSGTTDWLVKESEQFKAWQTLPSSLLWLHGKAGSGKSILSSSVIKDLRDRHSSDPEMAIAYFYFSFHNSEKQKVDMMLASLIKQICSRRPDTPQPVRTFREYMERGERPDTQTLETALTACSYGFTAVHLVIDALDECPTLNGERRKLLDSIARIVADAPKNLHVFCTSRREMDIDAAFSPLLSPSSSRDVIDLTQERKALDHAIGEYIDLTLTSADYNFWPGPVKAEAREILVAKADGMFQYVFCQFEALHNLCSVSDIRKALRDLPTGLDATYDRMLQSIDPKFQINVANSLKWLAFAMDEMTLEMLAEVFIIRPDQATPFDETERLFTPEVILKYLSGLVVVSTFNSWGSVKVEKAVRLAHFSVKEYLLSSRIVQGPAARFSFAETDAHLHIAHSCLLYRLRCSTKDDYNDDTFPAVKYAMRHWMQHLERVPRKSWPAEVYRAALNALATINDRDIGNSLGRWNGIYKKVFKRPLCFAAALDCLQLSDIVLSECPGTSEYLTQEDLDTALHAATAEDRTAIVQLLLKRGADVNGESEVFGGALQMAAEGSGVAMVDLLLDNGADINAQRGTHGSALQVATEWENIKLVQLLIKRGADINRPVGEYGYPLHVACAVWVLGQNRTVKLLLEEGADIDAIGGKYGTALQTACAEGRLGVVKFLLDKGADINATGGKYGNALQAACTGLEIRLVGLLLDRGADIHAIGGEHGTALQAACFRSSESIVELLLEKGANINATGGKYGHALQAVCSGGWWDEDEASLVARLLLGGGADINATGGIYNTALQAACFKSKPMAMLLLAQDIDVDARGGMHGSALQAACLLEYPDVDLIRRLLDRGANVNAQGGQYGSALQAACYTGSLDAVELLLARGANTNSTGGEKGSALRLACSCRDTESRVKLVRLLLDRGADVHARTGDDGSGPLQAACARFDNFDSVELVRLLLDRGADVNARGNECGSALQTACSLRRYEDGATDIIHLLLEYGAEVNAEGGKAGSALQMACIRGHVSMVSVLLHRGAKVDARGGPYGSAWHAVAANASIHQGAMLELFLDHGVDVNMEGGRFGSALQAVACVDQETSERLLIDSDVDFKMEQEPWQKKQTFNLSQQAVADQKASVRLLIDKGADVNMRGGKYRSALNAAIFGYFWDVVEILLDAGATPDCWLLSEPDEDWLARIREEDGRGAVERYRKFWEVQKARGPPPSSQSQTVERE